MESRDFSDLKIEVPDIYNDEIEKDLYLGSTGYVIRTPTHAYKYYDPIQDSQFLREFIILKSIKDLQVTSLVEYHGSRFHPNAKNQVTGEDRDQVYLKLRSYDTSLHDFVNKEFIDVLQIIYDVACGLGVLHDLQIMHRDLKSANILVYEQKEEPMNLDPIHNAPFDLTNSSENRKRGCIADFSHSFIAYGAQMRNDVLLSAHCSTVNVRAPEVFEYSQFMACVKLGKNNNGCYVVPEGIPWYSPLIDLWSLGMIILDCIFVNPFSKLFCKENIVTHQLIYRFWYKHQLELNEGNFSVPDIKTQLQIESRNRILDFIAKKNHSAEEIEENYNFGYQHLFVLCKEDEYRQALKFAFSLLSERRQTKYKELFEVALLLLRRNPIHRLSIQSLKNILCDIASHRHINLFRNYFKRDVFLERIKQNQEAQMIPDPDPNVVKVIYEAVQAKNIGLFNQAKKFFADIMITSEFLVHKIDARIAIMYLIQRDFMTKENYRECLMAALIGQSVMQKDIVCDFTTVASVVQSKGYLGDMTIVEFSKKIIEQLCILVSSAPVLFEGQIFFTRSTVHIIDIDNISS